ncbi:MAG TPA: MerR family transcriptional regulator [Rhizomicrobium sp.]|nr:MerR family transcriptional regulator [Rhizomicrobium sp.]
MGKSYTVRQLAKLAGVSVRTLHHYDEIGLLKPAFTGANRYRHYGETELLRLQQILILRELEIPLAGIGAVLAAQGGDRIAILESQRRQLEARAARTAVMIRTIERTIARLKGEAEMKDEDLYSGLVSPEKQAEYEAWLVEKFGPEVEGEIARSRTAMAAMSEAERMAAMRELQQIEQGLAEGLRRGLPADAASLSPLLERHRAWVALAWGRDCPPTAYAGLADVYEHPDFRARYEAIQPGFADYLTAAMRAFAARHV